MYKSEFEYLVQYSDSLDELDIYIWSNTQTRRGWITDLRKLALRTLEDGLSNF
jgi:inorganic pyrophosphatase